MSTRALELAHDNGLLPDDVRDEFFGKLKQLYPSNKTCFDCGNRNPTWISTSLGIFLCLHCSGAHRNLGAKISFVRSVTLDSIKLGEALKMEIGGNNRARQYFVSMGYPPDRPVNYMTKAAHKYRATLEAEAQQLLEDSLPDLAREMDKTAIDADDAVSKDSFLSGSNGQDQDDSDDDFASAIAAPQVAAAPGPLKVEHPKAKVTNDDFEFDFDNAFAAGAKSSMSATEATKKYAVPIVKKNAASARNASYEGPDPAQSSKLGASPYADSDREDDADAPLSKFKNAQAISSDALFGNENNMDDELATRLAMLRENAIQKASEAAVMARGVVRDAADWISRVSGQSFAGFQP